MTDTSIHVGDVGTVLEFTVTEDGIAVDLSSASTKQLKLKGPDGVTVAKTALFKTTGVDGILKYTTIAGDITMQGIWTVQAYLVLTAWTGHSAKATFDVERAL